MSVALPALTSGTTFSGEGAVVSGSVGGRGVVGGWVMTGASVAPDVFASSSKPHPASASSTTVNAIHKHARIAIHPSVP